MKTTKNANVFDLLTQKATKVPAYTYGIVMENGKVTYFVSEGEYYLTKDESMQFYSWNVPFTPSNIKVMLEFEAIANALYQITVKSNEVLLVYEDGIYKAMYTTGNYYFWKNFVNYTFQIIDISKAEIPAELNISELLKTSFASYLRSLTVESYETGILYIDGEKKQNLTAGTYYFFKNEKTIEFKKADTRNLLMEISGQEILTKDKAAIRLNFQIQYKVVDVEKAIIENKEYDKQLYILVQLAIREYIGNFTLDELMEQKDTIGKYICEQVKTSADMLGVELYNAGIKDIILPGDMKDILNQVLIAAKKAQANTITRREETASTRSLLNTAKLMEENEMLWRLKEMEYIEKIADKINSISVGSQGLVIDQLKDLFTSKKRNG